MSPDRSHLHHKLLNLGYSSKQVLILIFCLQILICASVVISFFLGETKGQALLFETLAFMILFFSIIHYSNRKKMLQNSVSEQVAQKEDVTVSTNSTETD